MAETVIIAKWDVKAWGRIDGDYYRCRDDGIKHFWKGMALEEKDHFKYKNNEDVSWC